ncbi:MAG: SDR family oxidoreductase, partial [Pseudomonadota bacterium]
NITAQFVACKAALPAMIERRSGLIVNMSSVAGKIGLKNRAPYSASKWAVRGLTAVIAGEVGEYGIRVNAILPGSVRGERIERVIEGIARANDIGFEEAKKGLLNRQAIADFIEPEEIAAMVAYLASDAGRSITGQFLGIDGGYE